MPRYSYTAYNSSGVKQQGVIEAENSSQAKARLVDDKLMVAELKVKSEQQNVELFGAGGLNLNDIEFFTSELALLLKSGLKIDKGLSILQHNVQKPALRDFLKQLLNKLKQGESLSAVLAQEKAFSALYVGLVKIAEETGDLTGVFARLSQELKYQLELNDKVKQALVYPSVILTVCIMALVFIFNFVVPNLTSLFNEQQALPGYTLVLLGLSEFMQNYQFFLFFGIMITVFALWHFRQHPASQKLFSYMREHMPVIASANLLVERIRFNAALATMLTSGLAIDRALRLAVNTLRTASLKHEVSLATEHVNRGQGLSKSLSETRLYPPYFAALLAIGEESGALSNVFQEIADRSRQQFYSWVTRFTSLLEPLLILFMGVVVGSIVVIMMLSISAVTDMSL